MSRLRKNEVYESANTEMSRREVQRLKATAFAFALEFLLTTAGIIELPAENLEEEIQRELNQVDELIEKGQYGQARTCLQKVSEKMGMDDGARDCGMQYPNSFRYAVHQFESVLYDKADGYDSYPTFTGTIKETGGNVAGYLLVQGEKEERFFTYNDRLIMNGDEPWKNSRVTVYYEEDFLGERESSLAVKLVYISAKDVGR